MWIAFLILLGLTAPSATDAAVLGLSGSSFELRLFGDPSRPLGGFPPATVFQQTDPVFVSVDVGGGFQLPSQLFGLTGALPSGLFTGIPLISGLSLSANNSSGSLMPGGGGGGGFGGVAGLTGDAVIGLLGGLVQLSVPLSPWGGGVTSTAGAASLMITLEGSIWTTGAAVVTRIQSSTSGGQFLNTVMITGNDLRTAGHAGTLTLVTPVRVLTNAAGDGPGFAIATLRFVPEPGTALLLGLSVLTLAIGGVRRRRG